MGSKKTSTKAIESEILRVLSESQGKIVNHKQIFSRIDLDDKPKSAEDILPILNQLVDQGILGRKDNYKFYKPTAPVQVQGEIDITKNGRIFLKVEDVEDDYVVAYTNIQLLPFDVVAANVVKQGKKKFKADVTHLISHSQRSFSGILEKRANNWLIQPDNFKFQHLFETEYKEGFKNGLKVMFKISAFHKRSKLPSAEVTEILGKPGEHLTEMHAILSEFGLPEVFEPEVQAASDAIEDHIPDGEIKKREDFRKVLTFTIDPDTAKDFDDAISYRKLSNGNVEIGVHIADVSHYVQPGSVLDKEALKRATSVYLVDRVVPMLPFKLSDVVCSLVPNKDRLTCSTIFEINNQFQVLNKRFAKTVIHSDKRFSYEEAQKILNQQTGMYFEELNHLNEFAKHLSKKRFDKGAMRFESTEYKFELDAEFKPIAMKVKIRQDTNKLIEELMLLANRTVAEHVYNLKPRPPFVYRTHDEPSEVRLQELKRFLAKFGYKLEIDQADVFRKSINEISSAVEGKPEQDVVRTMSIRSMAKAIYTINRPDHFGLAFNHYTHFTSPIRRYPDIIVHRLLFGYLEGKNMQQICSWTTEMLDSACKQSSKMEIQASDAERASIKYKQAEWMESKLGQVFKGVISGLTDFGMFVEIKEYKCEGMVRLNKIPGDYYEYDDVLMAVIGSRTFKRFKMGDEVEVMVAGADKIKRTIDLELILDNSKKKKDSIYVKRNKRR
jgi:ribonuclease R